MNKYGLMAQSQWSLTFESGKGRQQACGPKRAWRSQWSLTFEVGKRVRDFFGL